VLAAMGVDAATALSTIRLSVGRFTTDDQVDRAAELILAEVQAIQADEG
jgi:cysteine sulfinate desulfinase/cysteine desulfurase-like protein